jgi:hypothetical protein
MLELLEPHHSRGGQIKTAGECPEKLVIVAMPLDEAFCLHINHLDVRKQSWPAECVAGRLAPGPQAHALNYCSNFGIRKFVEKTLSVPCDDAIVMVVSILAIVHDCIC